MARSEEAADVPLVLELASTQGFDGLYAKAKDQTLNTKSGCCVWLVTVTRPVAALTAGDFAILKDWRPGHCQRATSETLAKLGPCAAVEARALARLGTTESFPVLVAVQPPQAMFGLQIESVRMGEACVEEEAHPPVAVIMTRLAGQSLEACKDALQAESDVELLRLTDFLLSCIGELHARQLVHGDISMGNVFVEFVKGTWRVRIVDLETARHYGPAAEDELPWPPPSGMATPAFAAPEIATSAPLWPTADIYSVGALLHWMLGGQPLPFGFPVSTYVGTRRSSIADAWLARALDRDPSRRFQSVAEAKAALPLDAAIRATGPRFMPVSAVAASDLTVSSASAAVGDRTVNGYMLTARVKREAVDTWEALCEQPPFQAFVGVVVHREDGGLYFEPNAMPSH